MKEIDVEYGVGVAFGVPFKTLKLTGKLITGKTSREVAKNLKKDLDEFRDYALVGCLPTRTQEET